jgi:hypothetical protein
MPTMLDIFNNDSFSAVEMTAAVNVVPNAYGRLNELNLMPGEGVPTTSVAVEYVNGTLNLLPTRVRGGPASLGLPERRNRRVFSIPHIPHEDFVLAEDVQNIIALGGNTLENVQNVVNRKLLRMRRKHAITLEHLRMGALKGVILDSDGSIILNLFTEFGITEKTVSFALGTGTTDVAAKAREVISYIEDNLMGDTMTGVHCLASPEFFASLIGHATVKEAYKYFASNQNPLRDDVRRYFPFAGVTFEEYRGTANSVNEDGTFTARRFIPAGEARFFPVGTVDTFATYFAPADFMDTVNTMGDEVYARQAIDPEFARWVKLHTQSNPLPLVKRPAVLVKGTSS